jgi:hypothetical protein
MLGFLALALAFAVSPPSAPGAGEQLLAQLETRFGPAPAAEIEGEAPVVGDCAGDPDFDEMQTQAAGRVRRVLVEIPAAASPLEAWLGLSEFDRALSNQFGPLWMQTLDAEAPECAQLGLQTVLAPALVFIRTHATSRLQRVLDAEIGFFDRMHDRDMRRAFFYTVQHSDHDPAFQTRMLGELVLLGDDHPLAAAHIPSLTDRLLAARQGLQRYGTIFSCEGGEGRLAYPLEDEATTSARRERYGLVPLEAVSAASCTAIMSGEEVVVRQEP